MGVMLEKLMEKTSFSDIFIIIVSSLALISFWRGAWGLLDIYFFPQNPAMSNVISVALGLVILLAIAFYRKDRVKKAKKMLTGKK